MEKSKDSFLSKKTWPSHIREYVQWQEKKEQEIEKLQGNLFDEN